MTSSKECQCDIIGTTYFQKNAHKIGQKTVVPIITHSWSVFK